MIPERILLDGFLCYREPQEICFDGAPLWMLSGRNGVGKSALFDAVTYALFGQHRDGAQNATELIHKDRERFTIEFDFALGEGHFRARRTLPRQGRPSQQLYRFRPAPAPDEKGRWEAVLDTTKKVDFERWVQERIGLSYKTFTSSVLLLQGQAEKLIGATNAERFNVLKAIVDLDRFERLHEEADQHRKERKAAVEAIQNQLEALPDVTDAMIDQARHATAAAEEQARQALDHVDRLQGWEVQARRWAEIQFQVARLRIWLDDAQRLEAESKAIEQDLARLCTLRAILAPLRSVIEQRAQIERSLQKSTALESERQSLDVELQRHDALLEQRQQEWNALKEAIQTETERQRALDERLKALSPLLARIDVYEQQGRSLASAQEKLAAFPAALDETLAREEAELDRLTALEQALPALRRLHEYRERLRRARDQAAESQAKARETAARAGELQAERDLLAVELAAAVQARDTAAEQATRLKTLFDQAASQRAEFDTLAGATTCHACGQPLTSEHLHQERTRRQEARDAAEHQWHEARSALNAAKTLANRLQARHKTLDEQHVVTASEAANFLKTVEQAGAEARRLTEECLETYHELAEPFRTRVSPAPPADWLTTCYPAADDLAAARAEIKNRKAGDERVRKLRQQHADREKVRQRIAVIQEALAEQARDLPENVADLRALSARLQAESQDMSPRLEKHRTEDHAFPTRLDQCRREREEVRQQIEARTHALAVEQAHRGGSQKALEQARADLPEDWSARVDRITTAELADLVREHEMLQVTNVEERARALAQTRAARERGNRISPRWRPRPPRCRPKRDRTRGPFTSSLPRPRKNVSGATPICWRPIVARINSRTIARGSNNWKKTCARRSTPARRPKPWPGCSTATTCNATSSAAPSGRSSRSATASWTGSRAASFAWSCVLNPRPPTATRRSIWWFTTR